MGKYWRSQGPSWTKFEGSSISRIILEKTTRRSFIRTCLAESTDFENVCSFIEVCLLIENSGYFRQYVWMTSKWLEKKQNMTPCGKKKKMLRNVILTNQHHFLTIYFWNVLNVNVKLMKQLLNDKQVFELRISAGATEKLPQWKRLTQKCGLNLRHGRTCSKMRWAILWTDKQESGAALQSFKSLIGWPSIQAGRTRICWWIVRSLLTNCLEMLVLSTNWKTWHLVVCE